MDAPINVRLKDPDPAKVGESWREEEARWIYLNQEAGGNPNFFPLTIKAAYVIGVIHDICESVTHLLNAPNLQQTYIPAYGVFASGIDVLGRCINGNSTVRRSTEDIQTGFKWLVYSSNESVSDHKSVPEDYVLIKTNSYEYTIDRLTALRHFAAHGQATLKKVDDSTYHFGHIDYEILSKMPPLIANGVERYWNELMHSEDLCHHLAKANIIAFRNWPICQSWRLFDERSKSGKHRSVTEIFNEFDWHGPLPFEGWR